MQPKRSGRRGRRGQSVEAAEGHVFWWGLGGSRRRQSSWARARRKGRGQRPPRQPCAAGDGQARGREWGGRWWRKEGAWQWRWRWRSSQGRRGAKAEQAGDCAGQAGGRGSEAQGPGASGPVWQGQGTWSLAASWLWVSGVEIQEGKGVQEREGQCRAGVGSSCFACLLQRIPARAQAPPNVRRLKVPITLVPGHITPATLAQLRR